MTLKTTNLTDLQLVLLSTAAARPDGSLLPPPASVGGQLARIRQAIAALLKRGLTVEVDVAAPVLAWRDDGARHIGAAITAAGRAAIGAHDPEPEAAPGPKAAPDPTTPAPTAEDPVTGEAASPARLTKAAAVLAMLCRAEGATLAELIAATGWLPHTTRAALTGLRKKGHELAKSKRGEASCYRIGGQA